MNLHFFPPHLLLSKEHSELGIRGTDDIIKRVNHQVIMCVSHLHDEVALSLEMIECLGNIVLKRGRIFLCITVS